MANETPSKDKQASNTQKSEASSNTKIAVGSPIDMIKSKFSSQRIPLQDDFAQLIELADIGRLAVGLSPGQDNPGPGGGLQLSGDKRLAVKVDPATGIMVTDKGVGINVGQGLAVDENKKLRVNYGSGLEIEKDSGKLVVQLLANRGLLKDNSGLWVNPNKASGIKVDKDGVGVNVGYGLICKNEQLSIDPAAIFKKGMIIHFYGEEKDIPAKWALCNGTQGTPDLRDKFVIGVGETKLNAASVATKGAFEGTLKGTAHGKALFIDNSTLKVNGTKLTEAQIPSHKHVGSPGYIYKKSQVYENTKVYDPTDYEYRFVGALFPWGALDQGVGDKEGGLNFPLCSNTITNNRTFPYTSGVGGNAEHNHELTGQITANVPDLDSKTEIPFYALCFIMYIG